ncbi:hypothetical protein ACOKFD_00395 [Flagellimonas sp. S174]|uniref:hypothetical protein n=1 Tax=Flagellimonas sp. S174 TaxID=3410790 RepID=UPI003BF52534
MDTMDVVVGLVVIASFVLGILIINKEKIRNGIYSIHKKDSLVKNIFASIIGTGLTIIVAYLKR